MTRLAGALLRGLHLAAYLKAQARLVVQLHALQKAPLSRSSLRHLSHLLTLVKVRNLVKYSIKELCIAWKWPSIAAQANAEGKFGLSCLIWMLVLSVVLSRRPSGQYFDTKFPLNGLGRHQARGVCRACQGLQDAIQRQQVAVAEALPPTITHMESGAQVGPSCLLPPLPIAV